MKNCDSKPGYWALNLWGEWERFPLIYSFYESQWPPPQLPISSPVFTKQDIEKIVKDIVEKKEKRKAGDNVIEYTQREKDLVKATLLACQDECTGAQIEAYKMLKCLSKEQLELWNEFICGVADRIEKITLAQTEDYVQYLKKE